MRLASAEDLAAFRSVVLGDRQLQAELLDRPERSSFVAAVVEHASDRGFEVEPEDVEEALRAARRSWQLRWI